MIPSYPATLVALSTCYNCIPPAARSAVMIYILANMAGLEGLTPAQLVDAAKCYQCIPPGMQRAVQNYLLILLANATPP